LQLEFHQLTWQVHIGFPRLLRVPTTCHSPSVKYNPLETGCSEYGIEFVGCDRVPNLTKRLVDELLALLWKHLKEGIS